MSKLKNVGYEVIYPHGCKEVHEGLKLDELKRRLGDLMKSLELMSEECVKGQDSLLLNETTTSLIVSTSDSNNLQGLLLHLTNEQFIDHHDPDVQLRVAVCLCYIIKIICPVNPFLSYSDCESITKTVLQFLLKCIKELSRVRSKTDKMFLPAHTILSICCEIDIFHFYSTIGDGDSVLAEVFHVFFDVVRRSSDWGEDTMIGRMVTDAMVNLLSSPETQVSETLVTYLLNMLVDRCSTKAQKQVVHELFARCLNKLEEDIQMVLQNYLIKNEKEEELSESSDNDADNDEDDDFCSLDSYKLKQKKSEKIKSKPNKVEPGKNTIEWNLEYGCHHVFQMIYEMFQISESIVTPLLPTIEMKLRSTHVTDRKRACRLLGKLFASSNDTGGNYSSLWETFLGRLSDIEVEVREICVRVARDLLKSTLTSLDIGGIMANAKEREDLVRAFQKRSTDQEESIRYLIVVAVSQILEHSAMVVCNEEMDSVSDAMFKLLLHQSRDKYLSVRKEAHAAMGKLYRKIICDAEANTSANGEMDLSLGLRNLRPGQRSRAELLLNLILRPYLSVEVEDRIVVERLFNTSLVPYGQESSLRMKSLLQCLTLCDDASVLCIHEMFKTQVTVMNIVRQTMTLIGEVSADQIMSASHSQKLREKVKKLSEYLSSKDKVDSLTKMFNQARSDKKLNELLRRFVAKDSTRTVIVKTIMDIKKHMVAKMGTETSVSALAKKKALIGTIKCILERGAPIIFDGESVQELLCHCVSTREARESCGGNIVPLSRTLRILHTLLIMAKSLVPIQETYEYLVSVMTSVSENERSNEDLCLVVLAKIVRCDTDKDSVDEVNTNMDNTGMLFSLESRDNVIRHTHTILGYLKKCCLTGTEYTAKTHIQAHVVDSSKRKKRDARRGGRSNVATEETASATVDICKWKYDCKVAKLAAQCLTGLQQCCENESRISTNDDDSLRSLLDQINDVISDIVKHCCDSEPYCDNQPVMLTSLIHLVLMGHHYEHELHTYATQKVPSLLTDVTSTDQSTSAGVGAGVGAGAGVSVATARNLSLWMPESEVCTSTQVKIQALKLLTRWVVTLRADTDNLCILYVISSLRKYIGNYGSAHYLGDISDGEMSHLRLTAGKCWLRIAHVQSFLPFFEIKWIYRLSSLVYDPCAHVRDEFLRKLHIDLYKLKLPLEYMAMFVFVPKIKHQEYLNAAKKYLQINITRRRDFLDTYPEYLTDNKKLFGILPEYVLSFVIHMLAHDPDWKKVDKDDTKEDKKDELTISEVKQCLWFVMEPILKMNENYSFIRKLLELIKHAQDATDPHNADINEKLYICSDIALGLLISKQSTFDLKEYPVELKLPRTRYIAAPNTFFNPDFANILLDNGARARVQFSPIPKSKQMVKNCMPAVLIKGAHVTHDANRTDFIFMEDNDASTPEQNQHIRPSVSKPKKHIAKIVMGVPEMESEGVSGQQHKQDNTRKAAAKHKVTYRSESPQPEKDEMSIGQTSVTKRGRVCKPNVLVMKDMVSPTKKDIGSPTKKDIGSPTKKDIGSPTKKAISSPSRKRKRSVSPTKKSVLNTSPMRSTSVRLEGTVSVNLEPLISHEIHQTLASPNKDNEEPGDKVPERKSANRAIKQKENASDISMTEEGDKVTHKKRAIRNTEQLMAVSKTRRAQPIIIENKKPLTTTSKLQAKGRVTRRTAPKTNIISKASQEKIRLTRKTATTKDSSSKVSQEKEIPRTPTTPPRKGVTRQGASPTNSTPKTSQDKETPLTPTTSPRKGVTRQGASPTNSTPKTSQKMERVTRHSASLTDSTPKTSQETESVTRHGALLKESPPKSSKQKGQVTRNGTSVMEGTRKPARAGIRATRNVDTKRNGTPISSPGKERVTRRSLSPTHVLPKPSPEKPQIGSSSPKSSPRKKLVADVIQQSSPMKERVTRHKVHIENVAKQPKGKTKQVRHPPQNQEKTKRVSKEEASSTGGLVRSKRMASQVASEELAKKAKLV